MTESLIGYASHYTTVHVKPGPFTHDTNDSTTESHVLTKFRIKTSGFMGCILIIYNYKKYYE